MQVGSHKLARRPLDQDRPGRLRGFRTARTIIGSEISRATRRAGLHFCQPQKNACRKYQVEELTSAWTRWKSPTALRFAISAVDNAARHATARRPLFRTMMPVSTSTSPHVLVVEDEKKTRTSLAEGMQMEGWQVSTADTGNQAIALLDRQSFDLLVLDWMLPQSDGLEVLRHARARGNQTPVLMLTARDEVADRVIGLEAGADDYLPKPFAFAELLARSRALLRRPMLSTGNFLRCGDLQLDTRARIAVRGGQPIALSPREVDVLEYLLRYQGQIVTREMLERDVWKQTQRFTSLDNVIDVQIMRLRRKVDSEGSEKLIHTLRGQGYRLGKEPA
jgi:two-component system copper resistance phosphate regulon response regulator CusR